MLKCILSLFCLFSIFTATFAAPASLIHEYHLKNGLALIVKEDHRSPIVVSMVWYKVGSSAEPLGVTGISHALEHMMFKGTPTHGAGEFSKIIAQNGGEENAFTYQDYTVYFQKLEKSRLALSFELEADRMQHLLLEKDDFAKEIKVVQEERHLRTEDDPEALTLEHFMAAAYLATAYQHPIIGWMNDLKQMQTEDLARWYQTWYIPNNATVVVVGDVNPQKVYEEANQYFSNIKPKPLPTLKQQKEPPVLGQRTIYVKTPAQVPLLIMGYGVPSAVTGKGSHTPYALEALSWILSGGESARLQSVLVRKKQIASNVGAYYDLYARLNTQWILEGVPTRNHTIQDLKHALLQEIKNLQNHPIPISELEKIKNQIIAEKTYALDSTFGQALEIGLLESIGLSWQEQAHYIQEIKALTPKDLERAAQKYLKPNLLTIAILDPLPMKTAASSQPHNAIGGALR